MNKQQQEKSFDAFTAKQRATLLKKGDDYANDDRLANFKRIGMMTNQSPAQACLTLIATKVARLTELLGGKSPKNESIADSVLDLGAYAALLNMILEEDIIVEPPKQSPKKAEQKKEALTDIMREFEKQKEKEKKYPWPDNGIRWVEGQNPSYGGTIQSYEDWMKGSKANPYKFKAKSMEDVFKKLTDMGFKNFYTPKCCEGSKCKTKEKVGAPKGYGEKAAKDFLKDMCDKLRKAGYPVVGSGYVEVK